MNQKQLLSALTDITALLVFYVVMWAGVVYFGELPIGFDSIDSLYLNAPMLALKKLPMPYPSWFKYLFLAAFFFAGLVVALNPFRTKSGKYGSAHFAREGEIKEMGLRSNKGVILGINGGRFLRTKEPLSMLMYAPPDSGKTAGLIIPNLLSCSNSAIVHDPKGELYAKTRKRRQTISKIVRFSPGEKGSMRWNPFAKNELPDDWADIEVRAERVAIVLIPDDPSKPNDHWPPAARSFFMFWCLYLIHRDGETSIPAILREPYQTSDTYGAIQTIIDEGKTLPERIRLEGNSLLSTAEGEFGSIQSTFKTNLGVFFDPRVAENFSTSDFALADLRHECTTIYLIVKNADQNRLRKALGLFFEYCTVTLMDHEPGEDELSVTAFFDEFVRLPRMDELLRMPALSRSYRFNAMFVCQSVDQIADIYGEKGLKALRNTCAYHIIFAQNELDVAENLSRSIGDMTRERVSKSGRFTSTSKTVSAEGFKLLTAQQIMSLPKGEILIVRQNFFEAPIKAKVPYWFKFPAFRKHVEDIKYQDISKDPSVLAVPANESEPASPVAIPEPATPQGETDPEPEPAPEEQPAAVSAESEDPEAEQSIYTEEDLENMSLDQLMAGLPDSELEEDQEEDLGFSIDDSIDDILHNIDDEDEGPRP